LLRPVTDGLIIALCYLQAAQVVHRHLRLDTVHWDGTSVQLADFGHAAAEWDDSPGAVGEAPWDAPEQRADAASADTRDDSYAAALLLARLITGQAFTDDEEAREAIARMDLTQQHLLRDAAVEYRRDRPTAYELRKRRRLPDPLNPVLRANRGHESEARARFAALRQRQRSALRSQREAQQRTAARGSTKSQVSEWWQLTQASSPRASSPQASSPQASSPQANSRWYTETGTRSAQAPQAPPTASAWPTSGSPGSSSPTSSARQSATSRPRAPVQRTSWPPMPQRMVVTGVVLGILFVIILVIVLS
jgi:hypothetical protein